jgi:cytochrome c oxidase subunit 2
LAVLSAAAAALIVLLIAPSASADLLRPESGGSPNADKIADLYTYIALVGLLVFIGVQGALLYCIIKFRAKKHPVADQTHGNTRLEIGWTAGAAVILVVLSAITFAMLPGIRNPPNSTAAGLDLSGNKWPLQDGHGEQPPNGKSLNISVNGLQYAWRFTYPDNTASTFDNVFSYTQLVVPVNTTVTLDIYSQDVAHAWWIPELGGKFDALPGYVNHTWFRASKTGTFKGQCAELCGRGHANMLAEVKVVPVEQFETWYANKLTQIKAAKARAARNRDSIGTPQGQGQALTTPTK